MEFFGTRIAKLKYEVETLKSLLEDKEDQLTITKNERNEWRKKYELAMHTPEHKLNAEDAFRRGQAYTLSTVKNNLIYFLDTLPKDEKQDA